MDWKFVVKNMLSADQVRDILITIAESRSDVRQEIMNLAMEDSCARKFFVRGLPWGTSDDGLSNAFIEFGPIEEAVVVRIYND